MSSLKEQPSPRVLFCMTGPDELNGPNVWLSRHLPLLRERGIDARFLYAAVNPKVPCQFRLLLEQAGVPCHAVTLGRFTEESMQAVGDVINATRPDVLVPNCFLVGYYAARFARQAGIATVGIMHSDDPFYHDLADVFVSGDPDWRLSGIVAVSRYLEGWMDQCCPPDVARLHAPYGVPISSDCATPAGTIFRLIYSGRLVERQKRIGRVLDRLEATVRQLPNVEAVVYGSGPDGARVANLVAAMDRGERLRLGGVLGVDQVMPAMCAAHALVLLSDFEGLPIALLEAMACGVVPIVARTRSGSDDVLRDGENALLIEPWDQGAFVDAVRRLREDRDLWSRLSHAARQTIVGLGMTSDACADKWAQFVRELSRNRPPPRDVIMPSIGEMPLPPLPEGRDGMRRVDRRSPFDTIKRLRANQRPVYLWGASNAGREALPTLTRPGLNICGFVDTAQAKHGSMLEGFRVYAPSVLMHESSTNRRPYVFITSMYVSEIAASLRAMGLTDGDDFRSA